VNYLATKRRRDMRRQRWQFLAVFVTITLGVMLFAASYDAFLNLESSYTGTYDRLGFADMTVTGADESFPETAASIEGVATVEVRRVADVPFRIGDDVLHGRLIGTPPDVQPVVNQIDMTAGEYLASADPRGLVAEEHLVDQFDLRVGDQIEVLAGSEWSEGVVVGTAVSAEYLWPAESRQNFFPPPGTFGVAFVSEDVLSAVPSIAVAEQTVILYDDEADRDATNAAVEQAAIAAGAADVLTQADQPSNAGLKLDLQGFEEMAIMFPVLFLLAAGMATFIILTRVVYSQRAQIGTLMASGVSRRLITRHYLSYGLILGLGGAIVGVVIGMLLGWAITGMYTNALGIPDTVTEFHWVTPIIGLIFGLAVGTLAALAPTRAASRLSPAEAMRGDTPTQDGGSSLAERLVPPIRQLPVRWLMVLRGVGRNRRRSLSTIIGVVLALTLILASWGMIDTVTNLLDRNFNEIAIEDVNVFLKVRVDDAAVATVQATPGVSEAEAVVAVAVSVRGPDGTYSSQLEAYRSDTAVHGFDTPDGRLPEEGVVAGKALETEIGVSEGDTLELSFPTLGTSFSTTIVGFVDEPLGTLIYMGQDAFERALADADPPIPADVLEDPSISLIKAVFDDDADRAAVIDQIEDHEITAAVIDSRALYDMFQDFLGFFYAFVGIMLAFGAVMAFALIFNTISVNVAEREGEYATMRANGLSQKQLASLITGENLLLTTLGILPGLVVGYAVAALFMQSYSSDMFTFELDMNWTTLLFSALAMIVVALLSVLPAIRTVRRLDIASVVRERST
jgi:putative ABC transport system permease protein